MTDPATGIAQRCFVGDDGFRRCNFVVRKGVPVWTKSGKWWRFPAWPFAKIARRKKPGSSEGVNKETATTSEK